MSETNHKKVDMLEKIYETRQIDFEEENRKDRKILSRISNGITIEEIEEDIQTIFKNSQASGKEKNEKQLIEKIELLIENYEIQVAYYSQKNYKRGFKDAMNLYAQCLKDERE